MVRAVCLSSAIRKCQSNLFINKKQVYLTRISTKFYSSDGSTGDGNVVSIGSVSKKLSVPQNPEFVPKNYLPKDLAKVDMNWMLVSWPVICQLFQVHFFGYLVIAAATRMYNSRETQINF